MEFTFSAWLGGAVVTFLVAFFLAHFIEERGWGSGRKLQIAVEPLELKDFGTFIVANLFVLLLSAIWPAVLAAVLVAALMFGLRKLMYHAMRAFSKGGEGQ